MKAIEGIRPSSATPNLGRRPHDEAPAPAPAEAPGRSLVALPGRGSGATEHPHHARPSAAFLAQLIATAQQAPQTRVRRRAEPQDATARYAASGWSAYAGRKLSRSM